MPRSFAVPPLFRSPAVAVIKRFRSATDPRRKDLSPSIIPCGAITFKLARHFGFCFGVEHAIEVAYRALDENPGKPIYLLGEMIHNPEVNGDLVARGAQFLTDTKGNRLIPFDTLQPGDTVIVPAFGTTVEMEQELQARGVDPYRNNATCPFVEKVWKRSSELGKKGYSVIIHGKRLHEETRATFSHSKELAPTLVVRDLEDTRALVDFLEGRQSEEEFFLRFERSISPGFSPKRDLQRVGVVNQTTMLATETAQIAETIRETFVRLYGERAHEHFADTRDTLCYATNENQTATKELIRAEADVAVVVGGFNSSNTSHLAELLEEAMPTFYIRNAADIHSLNTICHYNQHSKEVLRTEGWFPAKRPVTVAITSGASCPDATVDGVIRKLLELVPGSLPLDEVVHERFNAPTPGGTPEDA